MKASAVLLIVGFLLMFGGVGGVEHSITTVALVQSMIVALVGCAVAYCGVTLLKQEE